MSAFNGVYEQGGPCTQICSDCGCYFPELDEATELCADCFEHIYGKPPQNEPTDSEGCGDVLEAP